MKQLLLATIAFLLLINTTVSGQVREDGISYCFHCEPIPKNDWGLIFQNTFSRKFNEKLKGEINLQSRIMDRFTTLKALMLEPGIKFKLHKYFAFKSAVRYTLAPSQYSFGHSFRLHLAGYFVWHKEGIPFRIQYRTRVEKEDYFFWRNRIKIAFNIKQVLKPYSSFEIFNQSSNRGFLDLFRYEGGIKWEMHELCNITFMYRLESSYGGNLPGKSQVLGLMINYSLSPRKQST